MFKDSLLVFKKEELVSIFIGILFKELDLLPGKGDDCFCLSIALVLVLQGREP